MQAWAAQYQGMAADTPAEAASAADIVFSCVGNNADVREVTIGKDGAFGNMKRDAIFVDYTTASAAVAQELHAAARKQVLHFLDAPVSGGQSGTEQGILTVMVRGDEAPFARAEPVIRQLARAVMLMGTSGAGQKTKMVNQICVAGVIQGFAEGLAFYPACRTRRSVRGVTVQIAARSWAATAR